MQGEVSRRSRSVWGMVEQSIATKSGSTRARSGKDAPAGRASKGSGRARPPEEQMVPFLALTSVCRRLLDKATWSVLLSAAAMAAGGQALAEGPGKIPDLSSSSTQAWTPLTAGGGIARYGTGWFDPPAGLRGPIKQHPDYPLRGNDTGRPTPALGNYKDPILKPWAAE